MGIVFADMSVSIDGYVTGPNDSRENPFGDGAQDLHAWLRPTAGDDDRALLDRTVARVGAIVMGRRSFDKNEGAGGWGDAGPMGDVPCFVVTHDPPAVTYPPVFTFVGDGVPSAMERARHVAGDKDVHLFGATVLQQALQLGLVQEIQLHLMPLLLGGGTPLFSTLDSAVSLERVDAVVTSTATHLRLRVLSASGSTPGRDGAASPPG